MGLIKWLKKDNTIRRRESAPPRPIQPQQFDPNKTRDDSYREKLAKFAEFRVNERSQRLSIEPNDMCDAYHTIADDHVIERDTKKAQRSNSLNKTNRKENDDEPDHHHHHQHDRSRSKKISVQFHLNGGTTDDSEISYKQNIPRHSLPVSSHHSMYKQKSRKSKHSTQLESHTIREEGIKAFEGAYSNGSIDDDDIYSNPISPPMKFYRQNSNPYPGNGLTSASSEISELTTSDMHPMRIPDKPKRLMLNSKQSRKLLTEAHFNGFYRNFEIQSPYFSEDNSTVLSFPAYKNDIRRSRDTFDSLNGESASQQGRYQVITNKHGEDVEYALPCIDQQPQYQRKKIAPKYAESDDLANEVFEEDPTKCEQLINGNSDLDSSGSTTEPISLLNQDRVMITDLDKSTECSLNHENTTRECEQEPSLEQHRSVFPIRDYFESMQSADIVCLISDFIPKRNDAEIVSRMPLYIQPGTFKKSDATIRKYYDQLNDPDLSYVVETAIIKDLDVLRKIRHENIVNLMAIGFEPFRRIALIMEPTKYTLNGFLFEMAQQLNLDDVVKITKTIAKAVLYLQECNLCHSNISSHSILVTANVKTVKLAFFELTVPYKSDIQNEVELKMIQQQRAERAICDIPTKYLPYCVQYRRELSLFNYQAPELLSCVERFVFPTRQSDTYAITLLLWELLNRRIPFDSYDEAELDERLKTNYPLKFLPINEEERCQRFHEIFERGLKREPTTRIELEKMISKLDAIEIEIGRENDKQKTPVSQKSPNNALKSKQSYRRTEKPDDGPTPDKSISKISSIGVSPTTEPSPMNNAANATLYRSILDFNKLLSPRRIGQCDTYERSSTLKKRKKVSPTKQNKKNAQNLFGDDESIVKSPIKVADITAKTNELIASERLANDLNNAHTKSFISKQLDYSIDEEKEPSEESNERIENIFANKVNCHPFDNVPVPSSNTSQQFIMDSYHLPQELIARNNKIRRYTWLSTDQMNASSQYEPSTMVVATRNADAPSLPALDENIDGNQRLNVSIKIVRKQMSPENSVQHNSSTKSDSSNVSAISNEESFSVKSRIKFFRSLESQPVQRRTPTRTASNMSRRSEISFREARKAVEKSYRFTHPAANAPTANQQLMKDISSIAAELQENLSRNPYLTGRQIIQNVELMNNKSSFNDFNESKNESTVECNEKRNSVREAVQKFEISLRNDKNELYPFQKVENKLLIEKIFNTEPKSADKMHLNDDQSVIDDQSVTDEKVEDLIRVEVPSDMENESGAQLAVCAQPLELSTESDHHTQTLIKRTFYQESIVSGQNIEVNDLLTNSPNLVTTKKSSLTTHVTLNMRKCRRRSSDVGSLCHQLENNVGDSTESMIAPRMVDVRHSICGSPLPQQIPSTAISTTSGRKLEQISNEKLQTNASGMLISSRTQIQSIEDLYIDDDFGGSSLAANMELFTNSMDLLDGIDFNLISTRIYEETMSGNAKELAIEGAKEELSSECIEV